MNENTLIQLKVIVERAVRPVRASTSRKRKMREELLAHVSGVFEQELAQIDDERLAVERTAQRFGTPADVTSQLQDSIPASDFINRFWEGEPGETVLRSALRVAWVTAIVVLVLCSAAWFAATQVDESFYEEMTVFVASLAFLSAWLFGIAFVAHWMENSLHGPERLVGWPKISLAKSFKAAWAVAPVQAALIVGVCCLTPMLCVHVIWPIESESWNLWVLALTGALYAGDLAATSVVTAWVYVQSADERRRCHAEWASLNID